MKQLKFLDRKMLVGSYLGITTAFWKICGLVTLITIFTLYFLKAENYNFLINVAISNMAQLVLTFTFLGVALVVTIFGFVINFLILKGRLKSGKTISVWLILIVNLISLGCWIMIFIVNREKGGILMISVPFIIFGIINLFSASMLGLGKYQMPKNSQL